MQVTHMHIPLLPRDCTACASLQGHTYLTYGPLLNGATNVVFEGQPTYPSYSRCWEIVEKYKVAQDSPIQTAPASARAALPPFAQPYQQNRA